MKKRIFTLLLWLGGSVAFGQSINGANITSISTDGSNVTAAKVMTLPQVQSTVGVTPTPQTSAWMPLNGNGAAMVEFSANTLTGTYSVQVSNNPTPVSTPGTNLYTVVQDTATFATGGQGAQTKNWAYFIKEGWKYIRVLCTPATGNTGTLNFQVRLFGNPSSGDAQRSYVTGVPWKQSDNLYNATVQSGAATVYSDYKLPYGSRGIHVFTQTAGVSGASTLTTTVNIKDPVTGILQPVAVNTATLAAGFTTLTISPGYANPYPVATPSAGQVFFNIPLPQDIVIQNGFTGSGATTYTQSVVPIAP